MDDRALFNEFWTKESDTTRRVLARIPEGPDYKPDPKSRTAQEIAWQIVCEEKMLIEALESGKVQWSPPTMPQEKQTKDVTICVRWARPFRRSTGRVATSRCEPIEE